MGEPHRRPRRARSPVSADALSSDRHEKRTPCGDRVAVVGAGFAGLVDEATDATVHTYPVTGVERGEPVVMFMVESLFVVPERFDDEFLASKPGSDWHDPDVLYIVGDISDVVMLTEDEALAIFANSGQVKQHLHKKQTTPSDILNFIRKLLLMGDHAESL